jgi:hypothetical protein
MNRRPRLYLFIAALTLISVSLACAGGAVGSPAPVSPTEEMPGVEASVPTQAEDGVGGSPAGESPTEVVVLVPTAVSLETPSAPAPAILERRRLTLEFPPQIRVGDSDRIRLTLEMDDLGNIIPTAEIEGNEVTGEVVEIPNLYETHNVTAEARLDLAGADVRPSETISSPLLPGLPVTFFWSVKPQGVGTFRGTLWLELRFVDKVSGEESHRAVSAQTVQIEGVNFLGLSGSFARTAGTIGSILGGVIGFPFLEDIVKFLWKRRRRA